MTWCIDTGMLVIWCSCVPEIYCHFGGGYICPRYMCILLYVKLLWCSGIPYISHQFEQGTSTLSISPFCYMLNIFGVMVFSASMVNWSGWYIYPQYICILLYVKHIKCNSIP